MLVIRLQLTSVIFSSFHFIPFPVTHQPPSTLQHDRTQTSPGILKYVRYTPSPSDAFLNKVSRIFQLGLFRFQSRDSAVFPALSLGPGGIRDSVLLRVRQTIILFLLINLCKNISVKKD